MATVWVRVSGAGGAQRANARERRSGQRSAGVASLKCPRRADGPDLGGEGCVTSDTTGTESVPSFRHPVVRDVVGAVTALTRMFLLRR